MAAAWIMDRMEPRGRGLRKKDQSARRTGEGSEGAQGMSDIVHALYKRIQKMTPSRLEDAYLMDVAGQEIKRLRKLLDRIVTRNPDGSVAIRITKDALNAADDYLPTIESGCATDIRARVEQAKESGE